MELNLDNHFHLILTPQKNHQFDSILKYDTVVMYILLCILHIDNNKRTISLVEKNIKKQIKT